IYEWRGSFFETLILAVPGHADDLNKRSVLAVEADALLQRILCVPVSARHRLVNNHDARRVFTILLGKLTAHTDRNAHRPKVARGDHVCFHQIHTVTRLAALQLHSDVATRGTERQVSHETHHLHARHRTDTLDNLSLKLFSTHLIVSLKLKIERDHQRVFGVESWIDRLCI